MIFLSASADYSQNVGSYNFVGPESPNQVTDNVSCFLWGGRFALFRSQEILSIHSSQDIVNVFPSPLHLMSMKLSSSSAYCQGIPPELPHIL